MTRTIPRNDWRGELDSFSRQHEGWIGSTTTVEFRSPMRAADVVGMPIK